jgi:CRISPR-associated protein Cas1
MKSAVNSTGSEEIGSQFNLFTGEPEPHPQAEHESHWLFDPDFRLALPTDRAGKEITVADGVSLRFPADGAPDFFDAAARKPIAAVPAFDSAGRPIFGPRPFQPDRPQISRSEDCAQIVISGFGVTLGKKSERLQIKIAGKVAKDAHGAAYEFPFFRISEIVVASRGVSISSDLIREFTERGIRLTFLEASGRPYAMLSSPTLSATVENRRQQLAAYDDSRGIQFARMVVRGKIRNQRNLLLYCGKHLKQSDTRRYEVLANAAQRLRGYEVAARKIEGDCVAQKRGELMGLEGAAGRVYWDAFASVVETKAEFAGREHRGAEDPLNALLNYGYGILYAQVWGAVVNAGLEPFAGFLHVDRPGKPSLVLDMAEEFRQPVVDRTVIAFVNLGRPIEMKDGKLDEDTRRLFADKLLERLATREPFRGQHFQIRSIIQMQARSLVNLFRGKQAYRPFSFRW